MHYVKVSELRISYLVGRADRILRYELEDALADENLTINALTTLSVLASRPGLSSARLARRALVSPQAMNKVIRSLEQRGLIERSTGAEGGRARATVITDEGIRVLAKVEERVDQAEARFLDGLTETEREQLRASLARVCRLNAQS